MYYPSGQDWLKDYFFSQNKWLLISGHFSFAELLGLTENEVVSLLFIANRDRIYTYLLTIGIDLEREDEVKGILRLGGDTHYAYEIKARIEKIFGGEVHIIIFAKDNDERDSEYFSVSEDFINYRDLDSDGLEDYFRDIDSRMLYQPGTNRAVNKTVSDSFHIWSRMHLGRFINKQSINILDLEDKADDNNREQRQPTIINLRRIDFDDLALEVWEPYKNESSNYACHNRICETNNIRLRTLVYREDRENIAMLHDVSDPQKEVIHGRYVVIRDPRIIMNGIDTNTEGVKEYSSTRT